jgi:hypothetical protein
LPVRGPEGNQLIPTIGNHLPVSVLRE